MVQPTTFTVITSENGAFATSIPPSAFSQATQPSATQAQTMTIFSTVTTRSTVTSAGSTIIVTTAVIVPTAVTTSIADAQVTYAESMTSAPVTISISTSNGPQPTAVAFINKIDTSNPFVGIQIWKAQVFEVGTDNSWTFIDNGQTQQPISSNVQWTVSISANSNGTEAVESFTLLPNIGPSKTTAMLLPGQTVGYFWIQITTRLYRPAPASQKQLKIRVGDSLVYVDSSATGSFVANVRIVTSTTKRTTRTSTTRKSTTRTSTIRTSVKSTTNSARQTQWIIAETCKPGGKYKNAKNCCCAPNATKRITRTVLVAKGTKATPKAKRSDEDDDLAARQVMGQHLCSMCPLNKPDKKIVCCLPKQTVTKVVKTVYKTRTF
jgi:hypothetical protein